MRDRMFEFCTNCPHNRGEKPEFHELHRGKERCIDVCPEARDAHRKGKLRDRIAELEAMLAAN